MGLNQIKGNNKIAENTVEEKEGNVKKACSKLCTSFTTGQVSSLTIFCRNNEAYRLPSETTTTCQYQRQEVTLSLIIIQVPYPNTHRVRLFSHLSAEKLAARIPTSEARMHQDKPFTIEMRNTTAKTKLQFWKTHTLILLSVCL